MKNLTMIGQVKRLHK